MRRKKHELPAICPICDGSLYIEITPDTTDDDLFQCAHCGSEIHENAYI